METRLFFIIKKEQQEQQQPQQKQQQQQQQQQQTKNWEIHIQRGWVSFKALQNDLFPEISNSNNHHLNRYKVCGFYLALDLNLL